MKPRVLNKRNARDTGDVYVGRPTKWGNPFVLAGSTTRTEVIEAYRGWIKTQPTLIEAAKRELRGHNLVCWCAPLACHADILLEIANSEEST